MGEPNVCVVTALREVEGFVGLFREMLRQQTVRPKRLLLLENDSTDLTWSALRTWRREAPDEGVSLCEVRTHVPLFPKEASARRSAHLAMIRNLALDEALTFPDWTHVLFQDVQKHLPPYALEELLRADAQLGDQGGIVSPIIACVGGPFYDTWCFRTLTGEPFAMDMGRPPGRHYRGGLVEIGACGGVFLIRRAVLEAGCRLAGTDGRDCDSVPFCAAARAKGFRVWLNQQVIATHCAAPTVLARYAQRQSIEAPPPRRPIPILQLGDDWRVDWERRHPLQKVRRDSRYEPHGVPLPIGSAIR